MPISSRQRLAERSALSAVTSLTPIKVPRATPPVAALLLSNSSAVLALFLGGLRARSSTLALALFAGLGLKPC